MTIFSADRLVIGMDTEGSPEHPWSCQISLQSGTGYTIRANDTIAIARLREWIHTHRPLISLHYSLHDIEMLEEAFGWDIDNEDFEFVDTMIPAYNLCVFSQGLKSLAYRLCGMSMSSYEEQFGDLQYDFALEYLTRVASAVDAPLVEIPQKPVKVKKPRKSKKNNEPVEIAPVIIPAPVYERHWPEPDAELVQEGNGMRMYKPQGVQKLVNRILSDIASGKTLKDGARIEPRERWEKLNPRAKRPVIDVIGDMPAPTLDDIPIEKAVAYASRDSDSQLRITPILLQKVREMGLEECCQMDHDCIPILYRMEKIGIQLAPPAFWDDIGNDCQAKMDRAQYEIYKATGREVNPNSGDQVAALLYGPKSEGGLGLTPLMMTEGGEDGENSRGSTNDKCLQDLVAESPVVEHICDYREAAKVLGTYVEPLREIASIGDGRVHCEIKYTRTFTGRFATANPNLLGIPVRSELGARCRHGFVAPEGMILYDADLSQIEARTFAHLSHDPKLCQIFIESAQLHGDEKKLRDIHTITAAEMFSRSIPNVSKSQRQAAKACIAEGQLVLTDQGLVPIQEITLRHKVWDGVEWVSHEGLIYKGVREVVEYEGLTATPDHEVFTKSGSFKTLWEAALALEGIETTGDSGKAIRIRSRNLLERAAAERVYRIQSKVHEMWKSELEDRFQFEEVKRLQDVQYDEISISEHTGRQVRRHISALQYSSLRRLQRLWGAWDQVPVQVSYGVRTVRGEEFTSPHLQEDNYRPYRQQRELRAGESETGDIRATEFEHTQECMDGISGGTYPCTQFRQPLRAGVDAEASSQRTDRRTDHSKRRRACTAGEKVEVVEVSNGVAKFARVYDIVNAGPRRCFTVSGKLVANCIFGIINGITYKGLSNQMILSHAVREDGERWTEDDCETMIQDWFKIYPKAKQFQVDCVSEANATGLTRDPLSGRIRYIPQVWSPNKTVREEAERVSYAHRVQTSANTILRRAMKASWDVLKAEKGVNLILVIHDEKLWELPDREETRDMVESVTEWAFTQTTKLLVPIECEGGFGPNWGVAH